jgi:hypothetical protein
MLDETSLRSRLSSRTSLILGDVARTVGPFVNNIQKYPLGFVAFDLDYYTATACALDIFRSTNRNMLAHVPLYFDDISFFGASAYAGELLAIKEFNSEQGMVKIDPWPALRFNRPFQERRWLTKMYIANDMERVAKLATVPRKPLIHP